jgi:hypothetical protein
MSENTSTYGKTGAASLLAAVLVWSAAVALGETGTNPDVMTRSIGYVGLALLAIGAVALAAMLVGIYTDDDL